MLLPHYLYSGAKHIPLSSQRPFHFHSDQTNTILGISILKNLFQVFYCSIEPPSMAHQKQLDVALANLSREDPSLRITFDAGKYAKGSL